MYTYRTSGVCSREIHIDVDKEAGTIGDVEFVGGCNGNLKAIGKLIKGRPIEEVASILEGNTCGPRNTSCGDQLAKALRLIQAEA